MPFIDNGAFRRKARIILLVVVIVLLLSAAAAYFLYFRKANVITFTTPSSSETAGWTTYRDAAYGFEISYPPTLVLSTTTSRGSFQGNPPLEFYIGPYPVSSALDPQLLLPYPPLRIFPQVCDLDASVTNTQDIIVNGIVSKGRIIDNTKQQGFVVNFPGNAGRGWSDTCNTVRMAMGKDGGMYDIALYKEILSTFHFLP